MHLTQLPGGDSDEATRGYKATISKDHGHGTPKDAVSIMVLHGNGIVILL